MNPNVTPSVKQLRAFVEVYQLRKLSAAADRLFVTQSAVSMLIRQLEDSVGVSLFDRTTRSLQPTRAADEALPKVLRVLRDLESLGTDMRDLKSLKRGEIHLAATPVLGQALLPPVVKQFRQAYPDVRVVIDDCPPEQFLSRILDEQVDFGIGRTDVGNANVQTQLLVKDHLDLFCARDHPLASRNVVRWRDLKGHPVIAVRLGHGARRMIDVAAAKAGIELDIASEVSNMSSALWMASCGLGVAILPSAITIDPQSFELVSKPLSAPRVARDISVVTKRGRSHSPASELFVELLREHVAHTRTRTPAT